MNPILQALNQTKNQQNYMNNLMQMITSVKNGNADYMYQQMMKTNPQFKSFVDEINNSSIEEVAERNGVNLGFIKSLL